MWTPSFPPGTKSIAKMLGMAKSANLEYYHEILGGKGYMQYHI